MKNIKNRKLFLEAEQEFEVTRKRRKESLQQFDTLFRIDPTLQDEFMEEAPLPRLEKDLSSHTKTALWPTAVSRFSHFIMVHVKNIYAAARAIPFFILYRGPGTGLVKNSSMCFKKHKCSEHHQLKKMREWHMQKIDLNELKNIGMMGVRYQTPEEELEPDDDKDIYLEDTDEDKVILIEDDQELFKRQYLQLKHYEEGNLLNVRMFKYRVMTGEKNITYVEDQMSLRRKTRKDEIVVELGDMLTLFKCDKCNKSFELISSLAVHKKRCQEEDKSNKEKKDGGNEEIKCQLCGKVYLLKGARIHLEMECDRGLPTNMCIYCGELFCVPAICDWHVENDCDLAKEIREKEEKEKRKVAQEAEKKAAEEEAKRKVVEQKVAEEEDKRKEEEQKVAEEEDKRKEEEQKAVEEEDKRKEEEQKVAEEEDKRKEEE